MKGLLAFLFLLQFNGLLAQKGAVGDTVLQYFLGDTNSIELENYPRFKGYYTYKKGYSPDSITNEIFLLKGEDTTLIVVTEILIDSNCQSNLIIAILPVLLEANQTIEFNFCIYNGTPNSRIIAVMEEISTKNLFENVVFAYEILPLQRKVIKARKELVECSVDLR